jgi:hypothetical protein
MAIYWRIISILVSILEKLSKMTDEWLVIKHKIRGKKANLFTVLGLFITFPFQIAFLTTALVLLIIVLILYFPVVIPAWLAVNFIFSALVFCFKLLLMPQISFMLLGTVTNWFIIYTAVQQIFGGGFFSFLGAIVIAIVENLGSLGLIQFIQTRHLAGSKPAENVSVEDKTRLYMIRKFTPFLAVFLLATFIVDYFANVHRFLVAYKVLLLKGTLNPTFYQVFSFSIGLITIIVSIVCAMLAYYWRKRMPEWKWLFQIER